MKKQYQIGDTLILLLNADITEMQVDAIVNAANSALILGAGVAGVIHSKGGPAIQKECDTIGGTVVGGAVITGAGQLKAGYVIHAVGPRMGEGQEREKLASATEQSLFRASEYQLTSIAFPAISTGIFGYPVEDCAQIMLTTTSRFLREEKHLLKEIYFCLWGPENLQVFINTADKIFGKTG